ncbi:MAG TPA: hypothetical protein VGS23_09445, partial [Thermoplasmata archaeon]|nr:hypothetical protein [Thermoplasmata archaeon]
MQGRRASWFRRYGVVAVGIGCAMVLAVEAIFIALPSASNPPSGGASGPPPGTPVSVVDVELMPTYVTSNLSDTNYLHQSDCGCEPVTVAPGGSFTWWIRFGNTDPGAHNLTKLSVDGPFVLEGTQPSLPAVLQAGGSVNVTLHLLVPASGGDYDLTGA